MNGNLVLAAVLAVCSPLAGGAGRAQQKATLSERSYLRARSVLDASIQALGGAAALDSIPDVTVRFSGTSYSRNQSPAVERPYAALPHQGTLVLDPRNDRMLLEQEGLAPGGFLWRMRSVVQGNEGFTADLRSGTVIPVAAAALQALRSSAYRLPHTLVQGALRSAAATLRWLGEEEYEGRPHDVIGFALDGVQYTLYVDRTSSLPSKYEQLYVDPLDGDAVSEVVFPDYLSAGSLKAPTRRVQRLAGEIVQDVQYTEVVVGSHPADSLFAKPVDFKELPPPGGPSDAQVTELAQGVFLVDGPANVLFVAFKDHVVVVEPYGDESMSQGVLARIRQAVPGKPVKHVVLTHHHEDHSGGVRAYVAEGASIVTTPGSRAFLERMAAAPRTISPDALARNPRRPVIETFSGKRILTDGTRTLELHDIGPSPHADEMVIAYLPKEGILFQGDLLNVRDGAEIDSTTANETTAHFAEWLRKSGSTPTALVGVHSRSLTMDDLRAALELRHSPAR